ncbi:hypothetical protein [Ramlibacter sp.]|uniref:hypothetical protein n=1 Tax=Ramlibacter sp. TaxID=1917967 RepID=UPI002D7EAB53|nr:hypothetical protein [Ramlibacter sp.]
MSYPVGRCRFAAAACVVAWLLGGIALSGWAWQGQPLNARHGAALVLWCAVGAAAVAGWWRSPGGMIEWDGGIWHFGTREAEVLRVALDLQHVLLLCVKVSGGEEWLWAERRAAASDWDALRRAVYSRARTAALVRPPVAAP